MRIKDKKNVFFIFFPHMDHFYLKHDVIFLHIYIFKSDL